MEFYTADLCDEHKENVQVLENIFKSYGKTSKCFGEIVTLKLDEENGGLISLLKSEGKGRIAVVDVNSKYYAVVGENLMKFAAQNNWAGIVINGYVRDIEQTSKIDVALYALGTCPRKSFKESIYEEDISLEFAGAKIKSGEYLYADLDGIITSRLQLH
ncbi:MAG: ribonuclease E activity regulator RraA [Campylobacteraceae bacterium]|nr:ribonuclease E activity regulator RraA [Campylobacteraceae bacterium]